jgi:hypothetical protein
VKAGRKKDARAARHGPVAGLDILSQLSENDGRRPPETQSLKQAIAPETTIKFRIFNFVNGFGPVARMVGKQPLSHLAFQIEIAAFRQPANQTALLRLAQILIELSLKLLTLAPIDGSCKSPIRPVRRSFKVLVKVTSLRAITEYGPEDPKRAL